MRKILLFTILILILNSCGISGLGIKTDTFVTENNINIDLKKNKCNFGSLFFSCEKNNSFKNILIKKDEYSILLTVYSPFKFKDISFGILPLIPPPPIIPTFFFPADNYKNFCGGKNLRIVLTFFSDIDILDNHNINIDLNSIYLLKDNKKIYANEYYIDNNYYKNNNIHLNNKYKTVYIMNFPVTCKESDNSLVFIRNIKINDKNIDIPVGKILYDSSWSFGIGYMTNN